jgi:DeoR/GlpR family transcriptional regulator of sugar metabolism
MLASQRQQHILDQVLRDGGVRVSELVDELAVSDMTVRRDIEVLAAQGLVTRVHGGATRVAGRSAEEPGFVTKSALQPTEKRAIGRAAARLVEPGAAVAISGGTTTHALARALADVPDLTVVTNSLPVADVLHAAGRRDLTVVLTGGVRTPSDALVGPVAVAALRTLHVDWAFLGVHGMDERAGLTTPNLVEAETDRAMITCARRLAVVADHSKWGVVGLASIAGLDDVDVLITDSALPDAARAALSARVGTLTVVSALATDEAVA